MLVQGSALVFLLDVEDRVKSQKILDAMLVRFIIGISAKSPTHYRDSPRG